MNKYKYILLFLSLYFQGQTAVAEVFIKRTHASEFVEISNIDDVANRADLRIGDILYEFKSWTPGTTWWNNFFSGTGASYNQFKTYLSGIDDLGNLKYIYDAKKIQTEATQMGITVEAYMKGKFKGLFSIPEKQTEIFDIIWANQNLRGSLFDLNSNIAPMQQFENLINTPNSILYSFIKVE